MEENKVRVEVDLTIEDVHSFIKAVFYNKLPPGLFIALCIILMIAVVGSIIEAPPFGSNPAMTVILVFLTLFLVILPSVLKRSAVNSLKTNKLLQKTQKFLIGHDGIEVYHESGQGFIKWDDFYKVNETKDSFLFYISKQQAYIVPKRCLNDDSAQIELTRSYMKNAPEPPKADKVFGIFGMSLKIGCLFYVLLFIVILIILTFYSAK